MDFMYVNYISKKAVMEGKREGERGREGRREKENENERIWQLS